MFLYSKGANDSFEDIAKAHYKGLVAERILVSGKKKNYAQSITERAKGYALGKSKSANFFKDLIADNNKLLERLITSDFNVLLSEIENFNKFQALGRYPQTWLKDKRNNLVLTGFGRMVKDVFDYDAFVDKNAKWNAYHLTEKLGINVCVYCNRNYTFTITSPDRIVRPELDHFLPKSKYPYLALSFYNIVPSCHTCNSNLKHTKPFDLNNYVHPYIESIDALVKFSLKLRRKTDKSLAEEKNSFDLNFFYGSVDSFDVVVKPRKNSQNLVNGKFDRQIFRRVLNNINVFKIRELYNLHKDMIVEMIITAIDYNDDRIDDLYRTYGGTLFRSREDVLRYVTRNYPNLDEMPNRVFSKLTKDVFEELGIKYD